MLNINSKQIQEWLEANSKLQMTEVLRGPLPEGFEQAPVEDAVDPDEAYFTALYDVTHPIADPQMSVIHDTVDDLLSDYTIELDYAITNEREVVPKFNLAPNDENNAEVEGDFPIYGVDNMMSYLKDVDTEVGLAELQEWMDGLDQELIPHLQL